MNNSQNNHNNNEHIQNNNNTPLSGDLDPDELNILVYADSDNNYQETNIHWQFYKEVNTNNDK